MAKMQKHVFADKGNGYCGFTQVIKGQQVECGWSEHQHIHIPAAKMQCNCGHTHPASLGKYGCPNCEGEKAMAKKTDTPFKVCMQAMVDAYNTYAEAKDDKDTLCSAAYETFTKTLKVGDDDPPSRQAMEKVAKALSDEKVSKLQKDLNDITNALVQARKDDAQGELFKDE